MKCGGVAMITIYANALNKTNFLIGSTRDIFGAVCVDEGREYYLKTPVAYFLFDKEGLEGIL